MPRINDERKRLLYFLINYHHFLACKFLTVNPQSIMTKKMGQKEKARFLVLIAMPLVLNCHERVDVISRGVFDQQFDSLVFWDFFKVWDKESQNDREGVGLALK